MNLGSRTRLAAAVALVAMGGTPAVAQAARPGTAAESAAVERVVMENCNASQPDCTWGGDVTVSTADERFAWAIAGGGYYDASALVERSGAGTDDWRVALVAGGGVRDCREWYRASSARVVGDLRLSGLLLGGSGERCPGRVLRRKRCGSVATVTEGVAARARVTARGVTCVFARRTVRRNNRSGATPRRWSCLGSGEGSVCVRGDAASVPGRRWALRYVRNVRSDLRVQSARVAGRAAPLALVSLGDSFSSGEGAGPYDKGTSRSGLPENGCHRSDKAWPRLLGVPRSDHFACSGARVKDLSADQGAFGASAAGQRRSLADRAARGAVDAVTITMGGNDLEFARLVRQCWQHSGTGASCVDDAEDARRDLGGVQARLTEAYEQIVLAAGGAPLLVVGYPDILPAYGERLHRCGWLSKAEHVEVDNLTAELDRMLKRAAGNAGAAYASVRGVLDGNELCTEEPHVRQIARVLGDEKIQEMAHPDARGQRSIAQKVRPALERLLAAPSGPHGTVSAEGIGRVRIGMTEAEVLARFGPPDVLDPADVDLGAVYGYGGTADEPAVELEFCPDGRLTAFAVGTAALADSRNVRVGWALQQVKGVWKGQLRRIDDDYFSVKGSEAVPAARCDSEAARPALAFTLEPTGQKRRVEFIEGGYVLGEG